MFIYSQLQAEANFISLQAEVEVEFYLHLPKEAGPKEVGVQVGLKPPNSSDNNGATPQGLIRRIVHHRFTSNFPPNQQLLPGPEGANRL